MKLIERSAIGSQDSSLPLIDRVRGIWKYGLAWDRDVQAQQVLIKHLAKLLDNSYTLITNIPVPGFSIPVPVVLIGPTGLRTIYVSGDKGIFSFKENQWYKLDEQKEKYRASRPNLIRRTAMMSRAIINYLQQNGVYVEEEQPTLFFAQPGVYVEAPESPVHLLHDDGVDRFVTDFVEGDILLDTMELGRITDLLISSQPDEAAEQKQLPSRSSLEKYIGYGGFQLKVWQWLILFVLAILMLITLIITAIFIINTG